MEEDGGSPIGSFVLLLELVVEGGDVAPDDNCRVDECEMSL